MNSIHAIVDMGIYVNLRLNSLKILKIKVAIHRECKKKRTVGSSYI